MGRFSLNPLFLKEEKDQIDFDVFFFRNRNVVPHSSSQSRFESVDLFHFENSNPFNPCLHLKDIYQIHSANL